MKTPPPFPLMTPRDERDWKAFCSGWPLRMLQAADDAFARYTCGAGSRTSFEELAAAADLACERDVPPMRTGHVPPWFRRRLRRVLGPRGLDHLRPASPWFERGHWGSARLPLDVVAFNDPCYQPATQDHDVLVIEPIRPWVIGKTDSLPDPMTKEMYEKILPVRRGVFLDTVAKLLDQPMALAAALRCRLQLERAASGGWRRMRAIFVPHDVQEPDYFTPMSWHLRTCVCGQCRPPRRRPRDVNTCRCEACTGHIFE